MLRLGRNDNTSEGTRALAESPHLGNVHSLYLNGNLIDGAGQRVLRERFGEKNCHF